MFKRIQMTLSAAICSNNDQIMGEKRIAVEAGLIAILLDIVAPLYFPRISIERIENSGTRADEQQITHNCGRGEYSTVCVELPAYGDAIRSA